MIRRELAEKLLRYEPASGKLYWRARPLEMFGVVAKGMSWNTRYAGAEAFTAMNASGYFVGTLLGKRYLAHRVIWLMIYGQWPTSHVDHINGVKDDNRIENLREANRVENGQNRKIPSNNTSGMLGVCWDAQHGKWRAQIKVRGVYKCLGVFKEFEAAAARRKEAEAEYGFHPNHGRAA